MTFFSDFPVTQVKVNNDGTLKLYLVLSQASAIDCLNPHNNTMKGFYYAHFTQKEIEIQRG